MYGADDPLSLVPFAEKVALVPDGSTPPPVPATRASSRSASALAASWSVIDIVRADGFVASDVRPLVRLGVQIVAEQNGRRETGYHGLGGRYLYDHLFDEAAVEPRDRHRARTGADQPGIGRRAGGRNAGRARPRLARRAAPRGGRPRPRRRFQPQGHVGFFRPHRRARRSARRHRDRRRRDRTAARFADHRRRRHADAAQRADRGRHPQRLSAGPAECAADGHGADRQRPPRKLRPCADAAHDQHLHARRQGRSAANWSSGSRTAFTPRASAAGRSTSPAASSSSPAPRPIASAAARSPSRSRARR